MPPVRRPKKFVAARHGPRAATWMRCCPGQRSSLAGVFQVGHQNLGRKTVIGEYQRLLVAIDQFNRNAARLVNVAAADSKLPVDHRRIVENEMFLSSRSAILIHQLEW